MIRVLGAKVQEVLLEAVFYRLFFCGEGLCGGGYIDKNDVL